MSYIDENGNRYELSLEPGYKVWFVLKVHDWSAARFKEIPGSKNRDKAEHRLNKWALRHNWAVYPSVLCMGCATLIGKTWPTGHIATWYPAICDACGELVTCTEIRDYNHLKTVAELIAFHRIASGKGG
jgi:hypothetical protein